MNGPFTLDTVRSFSCFPSPSDFAISFYFYFIFSLLSDREILERGLEQGMSSTLTCLVKDRQIEVPTKWFVSRIVFLFFPSLLFIFPNSIHAVRSHSVNGSQWEGNIALLG